MGLIEEELNGAKKYEIKKIEHGTTCIAELTRDNVCRVEAMIRTDSDYKDTGDSTKEPDANYREFITAENLYVIPSDVKHYGSGSYWIKQLMDILKSGKDISSDGYSYKAAIKGVVYSIDRENSTHLNSDKVGREAVVERIFKINKETLKNYLKNPKETDYELIDIISGKIKGKKEKEYYHFSFATKFCHYVCLKLWENTSYEDNFSIYDKVLSESLPLYIKEYLHEDISKKAYENNYSKYIEYIDRVRESAAKHHKETISRNGFDHLIWYYHKGKK